MAATPDITIPVHLQPTERMIHLDQIDLNGDKSTLLVRPSQVTAIEETHDGGTVLHMVNGLSHIIAAGPHDLAKVLGFDVTGWVR